MDPPFQGFQVSAAARYLHVGMADELEVVPGRDRAALGVLQDRQQGIDQLHHGRPLQRVAQRDVERQPLRILVEARDRPLDEGDEAGRRGEEDGDLSQGRFVAAAADLLQDAEGMVDLALHAVAGMDGHLVGQVVPGAGADEPGRPGHPQAADGFGLQLER